MSLRHFPDRWYFQFPFFFSINLPNSRYVLGFFFLLFSGKEKSACVLLCFIARLGELVDELLVIWHVMKVHTPSSWVTKMKSEPPDLGWDVLGAWDTLIAQG